MKLERLPSEEDSYLPTPPASAVDHSGDSTGETITRPSSYLDSRVGGNGRGGGAGTVRARSPDFAQDHGMYYPRHSWNRTNAPLQNPPYIPTGTCSCHDNNPHGHSRSNPHNNSQIINEGTFEHYRCHPPSSISGGAPGFTPINQYNPVPCPLPRHRSPYAENIPLAFPQKRPRQPKEFRNVGPRDFEEPKRPPRKWRI